GGPPPWRHLVPREPRCAALLPRARRIINDECNVNDRTASLRRQPAGPSFASSYTPPMYNCSKCPGYCCSYPLIALTKRDVERLARHFDLSFEEAKARFTSERWGHKYSMRRKKDKHFGRVCRFFDTDERRCTVYEAR